MHRRCLTQKVLVGLLTAPWLVKPFSQQMALWNNQPLPRPKAKIEPIPSMARALLIHKKRLWTEVRQVIRRVDGNLTRRVSAEKRCSEILRLITLNKAFSACLPRGTGRKQSELLGHQNERLIRQTLTKPVDEQKAEICRRGDPHFQL